MPGDNDNLKRIKIDETSTKESKNTKFDSKSEADSKEEITSLDSENTTCESKTSETNNIFSADKDKSLKDSKKLINETKTNIFNVEKPKKKETKASPFLIQQENSKEKIKDKSKEETQDLVEEDFFFKENCVFYKFIKKWEKIGNGVVYLSKKEDKRRLYFLREGTMSKLFDFFLTFDCKPYKKSKGVGFISVREVDSKILKDNVLLVFNDQATIDKFFDILSDK